MATIVTLSHDVDTQQAITRLLIEEGHLVLAIDEVKLISQLLSNHDPELLILDSATQMEVGVANCRELRQQPSLSAKPLLVLTEMGDAQTAARFLDSGADDLLRKPFANRELLARVRALLRWANKAVPPRKARLQLVENRHVIHLDYKQIELTPMEFRLLNFLSENQDRYFTAEELLCEVWNYPPDTGDTALVRNHIRNLRRKLEADPDRPTVLISRYGQGYSIDAVVHSS